MKKFKKIDEIVYITKSDKDISTKGFWGLFVMKFFAIYAFINALIIALCTTYNVVANYYLILGVSFVSLLLFIFSLSNIKIALPFYIVATVSLVVVFFLPEKTVVNSFRFVFYSVINYLIEQNFAFGSLMSDEIYALLKSGADNPSVANLYNNVFAVMITVIVSGILAISSLRKSSFFIPLILAFLVLSPGFSFGFEINGIVFMLLVCLLGAIYAFSVNARFARGNKSWVKYGTCGAMAFVIFFSSFLISDKLLPKDKLVNVYTGSDQTVTITDTQLIDFNTVFRNLLFDLGINVNLMDEYTGAPYMSLDLLKNRNEDAYYIKSYLPNNKYIRQSIGVNVETNYWKSFSDSYHETYKKIYAKGFSPERQMYEFYSIIDDKFSDNFSDRKYTEKYRFAYDVVFLEYLKETYSVVLPMISYNGIAQINPQKSILFRGDSLLYEKTKTPQMFSYVVPVISPFSINPDFVNDFNTYQNEYKKIVSSYRAGEKTDLSDSEKKYINNEIEYGNFVRMNYLDVNTNYISESVIKKGKSAIVKGKSDIEKAYMLEQYFKKNFRYNDKVNYGTEGKALTKIMFETKEGYCSHFATMMTYILRSENIPARYVTGYYAKGLSKNGDFYTSKVNLNQAHAWVEVYFDGIGWLTFDPTPGFIINEITDEADYYIPYYEEPEVTLEVSEEISEEKEETPELPTSENKRPVSTNENKDEFNFDFRIILVILGIIAVLSVFPLLIYMGKRRQKAKFETFLYLAPSEAVKRMYRYMLSLLDYSEPRRSNGDIPKEYFEKVDKEFELDNKLNKLWEVMCRCEFGNKDVSEKERIDFYNVIVEINSKSMKKLNVIKRTYLNIKL